ncbi:MAG: hypothetical protein DMF61_14690 [Blastocatellia bacterium AA13]|nr:MAG: hypothetical protein DMF61_14690 [Blastocatellia bacterium AA13]
MIVIDKRSEWRRRLCIGPKPIKLTVPGEVLNKSEHRESKPEYNQKIRGRAQPAVRYQKIRPEQIHRKRAEERKGRRPRRFLILREICDCALRQCERCQAADRKRCRRNSEMQAFIDR